MSVPPVPTSSGLPVVDQALEPAWVRRGSASTQKAYATALAFEQTLVEQLARSLTATSGIGGERGSGSEEGGSSQEAQSGEIASTLPQALASGVIAGGGLGLAAQLTRGLAAQSGEQPPVAATTAPTTGASGAPAPSTGQAPAALTDSGGVQYADGGS